LPAQRTDDGSFAVDPTHLFRVFERQQSEQRPTGLDATVLPEAMGEPETNATSETATTNDIAVAFAALGAELRGLLGQVAEVKANDELHEATAAYRPQERLDVIGEGGNSSSRAPQRIQEIVKPTGPQEGALEDLKQLEESLVARLDEMTPQLNAMVRAIKKSASHTLSDEQKAQFTGWVTRLKKRPRKWKRPVR
jgi:hypothetical protein